jgi:hypothetical protein
VNVDIVVHRNETVKAVTVSGDPVRVSRGSAETSRDDDAFLGVLFQERGRTVRSSNHDQTVVNSGDLVSPFP